MLFLLFRTQKQYYGIESSFIEEIIPAIDLDPIPEAPSHIVGDFQYKKQKIRVLDFSQIMEKRPTRFFLSTRIIIIKEMTTKQLIGLRAEGATDLAEISSESIKVENDRYNENSFTFGSAQTHDGFFIRCINVDRLFTEAKNFNDSFFSLDYSN